MIIPLNKETQHQLGLWIIKARNANMMLQKERENLIVWQFGDRKSERPNPEQYQWGETFLNEIMLKLMSPDVWTLYSGKNNKEDKYCSEFSFCFVTADRYCWDGYGDLRRNGFEQVRRTNWMPGPYTIWTERYKFKMRPDKYGLGNLHYNEAMIQRGTIKQPEWSSHS